MLPIYRHEVINHQKILLVYVNYNGYPFFANFVPYASNGNFDNGNNDNGYEDDNIHNYDTDNVYDNNDNDNDT